MHVNNPDAVRLCVARLDGWKLGFDGYSKFWQGCSADIKPEEGSQVIGVVWVLKDIDPLDKQEVGYDPIQVQVQSLEDGKTMVCRTYVEHQEYLKLSEGKPKIPSLAYKNVCIAGALESGLPKDYIDNNIMNIETNGIIPETARKLVPECTGLSLEL